MDAAVSHVRPWTVAALLSLAVLAAGGAAGLILLDAPGPAGVAVGIAAVALAAGGNLAARAGAPRLRLVASTSERAADAAVLGALAWVLLPGSPRAGAAAVTALSAAFVAAYLRVKGTGLGFRMAAWPPFQPLRLAAVALALLTPLVEAGLWGAAAVGVVEAGGQTARVAGQEEPTP